MTTNEKDEMLDDIPLDWLTHSATSSAQLSGKNHNNCNAVEQKTAGISVPVAVTVLPGESYRAPRSWAEQSDHKLIAFTEVDKRAVTSRCGHSRNSSLPSSARRSDHCANRGRPA